jgi:hypothetical protein
MVDIFVCVYKFFFDCWYEFLQIEDFYTFYTIKEQCYETAVP